jgi:hypothetical protein
VASNEQDAQNLVQDQDDWTHLDPTRHSREGILEMSSKDRRSSYVYAAARGAGIVNNCRRIGSGRQDPGVVQLIGRRPVAHGRPKFRGSTDATADATPAAFSETVVYVCRHENIAETEYYRKQKPKQILLETNTANIV